MDELWRAYPCKFSWRAKDKNGYSKLSEKNNNETLEHRTIYKKFYKQDIKSKEIVMHLCNNPGCIEIHHLKLGTDQENSDYKLKCNRDYDRNGENNGSSKLTEKDVIWIRETYKSGGYMFKYFALKYGVSKGTIENIIYEKTWTELL